MAPTKKTVAEKQEAPFVSPFAGLKKVLPRPVEKDAEGITAKPAKRKKENGPQTFSFPAADDGDEALFAAAMHNTDPLRGKEKNSPQKEGAPVASLARKSPAVQAAVGLSGTTTGTPAASAPVIPVASAPPDNDDDVLFTQAMAGVSPVTAGGRDLNPGPSLLVSPISRAEQERAERDAMLHGSLEFSLAYSEEYIEGRVNGLDPLVIAKLRNGEFSGEGHLDLHGLNVDQAYNALNHFMRESYHAGKRHLLLITGRGRNSPGGAAILRERVQAWLIRDPFKRVILAFCTAQPRDGGAGALYVLIRKRKKNQGKIVWDRMPTEEELLL